MSHVFGKRKRKPPTARKRRRLPEDAENSFTEPSSVHHPEDPNHPSGEFNDHTVPSTSRTPLSCSDNYAAQTMEDVSSAPTCAEAPSAKREGARSRTHDELADSRSDQRSPSPAKSAGVSPLSNSDLRPAIGCSATNNDTRSAVASTSYADVRPLSTSDLRPSMSYGVTNDDSPRAAASSSATSSNERRAIQACLETRYVSAGTAEAQAFSRAQEKDQMRPKKASKAHKTKGQRSKKMSDGSDTAIGHRKYYSPGAS
ncbi:hypothetical protein HPB50_006837 [Hyalomma asiaticum]|uniref:Uncharacterized protein n=1 Tax=Hyalomma asiaticum TaxID=266040 RepID=A0ACB7SNE2_HYAAI|nr:hypothetical protein HPB50_006837 [Hyalomma asiaticum]